MIKWYCYFSPRQLDGHADFIVPFSELRALLTVGTSGTTLSLSNMDVWANVSVWNWWEGEERRGWAFTQIFTANANIKFLGGEVRPYKPGMYFTAYVSNKDAHLRGSIASYLLITFSNSLFVRW